MRLRLGFNFSTDAKNNMSVLIMLMEAFLKEKIRLLKNINAVDD